MGDVGGAYLAFTNRGQDSTSSAAHAGLYELSCDAARWVHAMDVALSMAGSFWFQQLNRFHNFQAEWIYIATENVLASNRNVTITLEKGPHLFNKAYLAVDLPAIQGVVKAVNGSTKLAGPSATGDSVRHMTAINSMTRLYAFAFPVWMNPEYASANTFEGGVHTTVVNTLPHLISDGEFDGADGASTTTAVNQDLSVWVRWCDAIGYFIMAEISFKISNAVLITYEGLYMFCWAELTDTSTHQGLSDLVGHFGEFDYESAIAWASRGHRLYVPLPFSWCGETNSALPAEAFPLHKISLVIKVEALQNLVLRSTADTSIVVVAFATHGAEDTSTNQATTPQLLHNALLTAPELTSGDIHMGLVIQAIYLDRTEADYLTNEKFDLVIHQAQHEHFSVANGDTKKTFSLRFVNSCTSFFFVYRSTSAEQLNMWSSFHRHDVSLGNYRRLAVGSGSAMNMLVSDLHLTPVSQTNTTDANDGPNAPQNNPVDGGDGLMDVLPVVATAIGAVDWGIYADWEADAIGSASLSAFNGKRIADWEGKFYRRVMPHAFFNTNPRTFGIYFYSFSESPALDSEMAGFYNFSASHNLALKMEMTKCNEGNTGANPGTVYVYANTLNTVEVERNYLQLTLTTPQ